MGDSFIQLGAAALSGSVLRDGAGFLWKRLRRDPKTEAESRKLNAEAEQIEWKTLSAEIRRLQKRVEEQDRRIAELEKLDHERMDREAGLEKENHRLRIEVSSLRKRVGELEEIIKTKTTPEDMLAQLAEIDRKTGRRS